MKYEAHIPTEQYGYISVEVEGTALDAVAAYKELQDAWKDEGGVGLTNRDWCRFLDTYLSTGSPPEDGMSLWQDMNMEQRRVVNEFKKCLKRINKSN